METHPAETPAGMTSIVIPTCNHWEYTRQCIESIRRYTEAPYEIIVVDNGSSDETVRELRAQEGITLLENPENEGFPKACNQGMRAARGDQIAILNNDVVVTHHWLDNLLSCLLSDPDRGAVGPVSNYVSGVQICPAPYASIEEMHEWTRERNRPDRSGDRHTLRLVGFCLLFRRSLLNELGGFDESFSPGNFEDDDFCMRVRRAGYRLVVAPDTFVHHYGSVTQRTDPLLAERFQTNLSRFMNKWGVNPLYSFWTREDLAALVPERAERVLDVGCACGGLGLSLKNRGVAHVAGIEFDENPAIDARTVLDEVWIGDASVLRLPRPPQWFDALVFADVLEHLPDPGTALRNLLPYLKPGGCVVASIPNVGHASVVKGLLEGLWTYGDAGVLDRTHLRFYTLAEMARLFESAGLQIEFVGMVQDADPELVALCSKLGEWAKEQSLPSFGPSFEERCLTVQYYIRASKVFKAN